MPVGFRRSAFTYYRISGETAAVIIEAMTNESVLQLKAAVMTALCGIIRIVTAIKGAEVDD